MDATKEGSKPFSLCLLRVGNRTCQGDWNVRIFAGTKNEQVVGYLFVKPLITARHGEVLLPWIKGIKNFLKLRHRAKRIAYLIHLCVVTIRPKDWDVYPFRDYAHVGLSIVVKSFCHAIVVVVLVSMRAYRLA